MPVPIRLPDLGAGDAIVRVGGWLVEAGDRLEEGDRIVEVLLPGITFAVSAPVSGRLGRIEKPFDAFVSPGDVLGWIHEEADA